MLLRLCLTVMLTVVLAAGGANPAGAAQEFQKNNPDIGKYEFARSYLTALSYVNNIDRRWEKTSPKKLYAGDEVRIMRGYVAHLSKDSAELRIAKNLLSKYLQSPNMLIRKTADMFITACLVDIGINEKEKEVWDQWYAVTANNLDTKLNERAFVNAQYELGVKRKENDNNIINASILLTKVLRSARNANEKGSVLALTPKERDRLLDLLDTYGKDTLDWGLKPGQNHVQASVAVIREVLEDPIYTTLK